MGRYNYENQDKEWEDPVRLKNGPKVAWWILGHQTEPDEDTECTGIENRTGWLVAMMVGDDAHHLVDEDDILPLADDEFCSGCGQIGCGWC